jgi:hypothetical protein
MSRTGRTGGWAALVAVFCLGFSSAAFYPGGAAGQLRDPPFGWDMWDPEWTQRDAWRPDRMDSGAPPRSANFHHLRGR